MKTEAEAEGLFAFAEYLAMSPKIKDTSDSYQCGQARVYFGFDESFINDEAICSDVEQLRFSKDFEVLQEFFKQGDNSDGASGPTTEREPKTLEPFVLKEISRGE